MPDIPRQSKHVKVRLPILAPGCLPGERGLEVLGDRGPLKMESCVLHVRERVRLGSTEPSLQRKA